MTVTNAVEADARVLARCASLATSEGLATDANLAPILDLGILACGSPALLRRSVTSWVEFARHHRREVHITIVDDSPTVEQARAQRAAAAALEGELGIRLRFVDPVSRAAIAEELSRRAGVDAELAEFVVAGCAQPRVGIGGNRNLLHLLCPGRRLLCADDDIVARFAIPERHALSLWITSEDVPMHTWFFDSPAATDAAVAVSMEPDALALHESFVGHTVAEVVRRLDGPASLRGAGPELRHVIQSAPVRIAATALGLAGDSASDCLAFFSLLADGDTAGRVLARTPPLSPSREILRRPEFPVLCQGVYFMTFCHAVDNTLALPPYFPVGRGEDQVWQKLLHCSLPETVVGHLPLAVRHRPQGERRYSREDYLDPCARFPGNAFLLGLFGTVPPYGGPPDADARLDHLGRYLAGIAGDKARFDAMLRGAWHAYLGHHDALVRTAVAARPAYPAWWQDSMREILERLGRQHSDDAGPPLEYAAFLGPPAAEALRHDVLRFARLLPAWPALRAAAAGLAQDRKEDPEWLRP